MPLSKPFCKSNLGLSWILPWKQARLEIVSASVSIYDGYDEQDSRLLRQIIVKVEEWRALQNALHPGVDVERLI